MESKFKVGDRVVIIRDYDKASSRVGEYGYVISADHYEQGKQSLGVRYDLYNPERHDLGGKCNDGYGYYVPSDTVQKANDNIHTDIQSLKDKYPQFNITVSVEEKV